MNKKNALVAIALLIFLTANIYAGGSDENTLRVATGDKAGTYYSYGSLLAPILTEKTQIQFKIISTSGSIDNIRRLGSARVDLAIIQNDMADHAWKEAHFFEGKKNTDFAAIASLYTEACHIVADPASNINSIADLKGKKVSLGDHGSATEINARQILEAYGVSLDDIQKSYLGFGASVQAMKNHKIDAFFCVAGTPTPAIVQLSASKEIVFLEIDDEHLAKLKQYDPYYTRHTIKAGTYQGQEKDIKTLGLKATLVASWKLSDDVVYLITKNLFESKSEITDAYSAGDELSIDFADDHRGVTIPFHPGASRYYKEINKLPVIPLPMHRPD